MIKLETETVNDSVSMFDRFLKTVLFLGFSLSGIAGLSFFAFGKFRWCFGLWTGALWFYLNLYCLFRLIGTGFLAQGKNPGQKIAIFSVLKFPVLYVGGYFILKSRFFPAWSLVTGLSVFFFAFLAGCFVFNIKELLARKGIV